MLFHDLYHIWNVQAGHDDFRTRREFPRLQVEVQHATDAEGHYCSLVGVYGEVSIDLFDEHLAGTLRHTLDVVASVLHRLAILDIQGDSLVGCWVALFDNKLTGHVLKGHAFKALIVFGDGEVLA